MLTVKKSDIGKRVICGIYLESGKTYGEIVSFTDDVITVRTEPYNREVDYSYDDVDMDFQRVDGKIVWDDGGIQAKEAVVVKDVEVGAELNIGSACPMISVKNGI